MAKNIGTDVLIELDDVAIVGITDQSISISRDLLDATDKDSANAKEYEYGEYGGTVSVTTHWDEAAAEGVSEAFANLTGGSKPVIKWGKTGSGSKYFTGTGLISGLSINAPKNEMATATFDFTFSGAITEATVV